MSLMRLLTALQQQGRTQLTSTVARETRRIVNARYDKTPTAKSLTCLLGQRSDGYNSQRIAPLQADWKLSPRTLHSPHQGIAEREDEEKKKKKKRTDRVRSNKEFSSLVRCEPAAPPLLLLLWLLWSHAIKDT